MTYSNFDKVSADTGFYVGKREKEKQIFNANGEFQHTDGDFIVNLGDAAGAKKVIIKDSGGIVMASVTSDGDVAVNTDKFTVAGATGNTVIAGNATIGNDSANELVIAGAAAGSPPTITSTGSDADVGINLVPKGLGRAKVTANGLDVTGTATVSTSLAVGAGTAITKISVYAPSLTPASVAADTSAEQTFTVTGLTTTDNVIVNGPAVAAGTGIVNARVSAADTLALTFMNATAAAVTPTAGTYYVVAIRS